MGKFTSLIVLLILSTNAICQHDFYTGGSVLAGFSMNQFSQGRRVLDAREISTAFGASLFLQYRFMDRIGLEVGIMQSVQNFKLQDKKFAERNPGFQFQLDSRNYYYSYYGSVSYAQPVTPASKLYVALGYAIQNAGTQNKNAAKTFIVSGEEVAVNSTNMGNAASLFFEGGIDIKVSNRCNVFLGFRYNKGSEKLVDGTYASMKDGEILSSDNFYTQGNMVGLHLGVKVNLFHMDKKIKTPKPTAPPLVTPTKKVEGRTVIVSRKITVKSGTVTVWVWDDQKVDGDIISLNLNGQWIVQDYTLEKKRKGYIVTLRPGENTFVLHALNLGKIKPNTAAMLVDDGSSKQKLLLESDLESSGALIIDYVK